MDGLVQEIDIYPTLMSLLGLPVHDGVQGHNLAPLFCADSSPANENAADGPPWGDLPEAGIPAAEKPGHSAAPAYDHVFWELTTQLLDMYDVIKDPLPHRLTQA